MVFTTKDLEKICCAKTQSHKEIYKMLLEDIYKKIKLACQNNRNNLMYTFRPIIPGYPLYNINHACTYAERKLKKGGFRVNCDYDNYVKHVFWS